MTALHLNNRRIGPARRTDPISPDDLRRVSSAFPTGVTVIAALVQGTPVGMAANSFASVSLDPPLVSVCLARTSNTAALLHQVEHWGISILGAHQTTLSRGFAMQGVNRFEGVGWEQRAGGAVVIDEASAWLTVSLFRLVEAGDHDVALLTVQDLAVKDEHEPLVFHGSRYRNLAAEPVVGRPPGALR